MPESRPTLLVFTLGPSADRRRRPLLPGRGGELELELRRRCLDVALEAGRRCGCRRVVASPERLELPPDVERVHQSGDGFGQRLREAMRAARVAGEPLVVVGSDVPDLDGGAIVRALDLLEDDPQRVVVGPSPDGGVYLLASVHPLDEVLSDVSWCHRGTLESLLTALRRAGRPAALLAPLADLDRPRDLHAWWASRTAPRALRDLLGLLLGFWRTVCQSHPRRNLAPPEPLLTTFAGRAPPPLPAPR